MKTETSIWAYPWDLLNEGVETALEKISSLGLDAVSLAASYHSGKFISPRNPRHKVYFPEGGVVYFQPSEARFKDLPLQPCVSELAGKADILGRAGKPLQANRFTVCGLADWNPQHPVGLQPS